MKNDNTYFLVYQASAGIIKKYYPPQVYPFEWQGIEFFVHKVINDAKDETPIFSTMFYQVSEKETGKSLKIENTMTIVDAEKQAIGKLEKVGLGRVKEIIAKVKGDAK